MARGERYFIRTDEFISERWITKPELYIRKGAFMTILTGPYTYAGRNLAMIEMRSVIERVVKEFWSKLPSKFDKSGLFERSEDHRIAGIPKVRMTFVKRRQEVSKIGKINTFRVLRILTMYGYT